MPSEEFEPAIPAIKRLLGQLDHWDRPHNYAYVTQYTSHAYSHDLTHNSDTCMHTVFFF